MFKSPNNRRHLAVFPATWYTLVNHTPSPSQTRPHSSTWGLGLGQLAPPGPRVEVILVGAWLASYWHDQPMDDSFVYVLPFVILRCRSVIDHRRNTREMTSKMRPPKTTKPRRTRVLRVSRGFASWQKQRKRSRTEPDGRDGRLGRVLGPLLDLVLRLAHARLVILGELEVCPPLLRCLRLWALRLVNGRLGGKNTARVPLW